MLGSRSETNWPQFALNPNGSPPEEISPDPFEYARLAVADDTPEFHPRFDPILYSEEPDFSVSDTGLQWWEARHFRWVTLDGKRVLCFGCTPYGLLGMAKPLARPPTPGPGESIIGVQCRLRAK